MKKKIANIITWTVIVLGIVVIISVLLRVFKIL